MSTLLVWREKAAREYMRYIQFIFKKGCKFVTGWFVLGYQL